VEVWRKATRTWPCDRLRGSPDQPPLKLRRDAEALAQAEGLRYEFNVVQGFSPAR